MLEKKIGMVCSSQAFGGLELNMLKFASWLQDYGWEVHFLADGNGHIFKNAPDYVKNITSIQEFSGGKNKLKASSISKWMQKINVKVLFTAYNKDLAPMSWYKRFYYRGINLVYQQQMKVGVNKRDFIHTFRYNMIDCWISPLQYLKQETLMRTKVPANKIEVIPLSINADLFVHNQLSQQEARKVLNLPENDYLVGVLGRIDPQKAQDFLIRAVAYLRDEMNIEIPLLIMGSVTALEGDSYLNKLHELVKKHKLENLIYFRDFSKDVMPFYKSIDVFAIPSYGEPFGMVTVEAMASGCPVIGVNRDGTKELLQDGELGYLYENDNLEDFSKKLLSLKNNEKLNELTDKARKEVLEKYTTKVMCEKLDNLLTRFCS